MKLLIKLVLILFLNVYCFSSVFGQTNTIEGKSYNKTSVGIPPLVVVMDSVLKRNAMLRFRRKHIGVKSSTLKSERIYWSRNMGIQADTRYGNLNSFSTNEDGQIASALSTTSKQFNYSVGFYFKFPLFDLLNRKHQIELAKLEVEEAESMLQFQEDEIRQTVIRLYHDLVLKQRLLKIKSQNFGNGRVNMEMVEKEFTNGVVPIAEYVRITSMTSNLEADYESSKSDFLLAKQLLEDMAGFVFTIKY